MKLARLIRFAALAVALPCTGATPDAHTVAKLLAPAAGIVRIASFREVISPEDGAKICGYDADQVSVANHEHTRRRQIPQGQGREAEMRKGETV